MSRVAVLLLVLPLAAALCPQGAVQGTRPDDCYLYGDAQSWQQAQQYCASNKGHLSSIPNAFVNAFLISYPKAFSSAQPYWLGAELKTAADKWAWTDGSNFTYTKWARGEPKKGPGCLYMDPSTGLWHNGECAAAKPFVCKVPPSFKAAQNKCEEGWTFNEKLKKCYKAKVASYYPLVILGLKNNAIAPWSGSQVFDYQWTDGSFVNYSLLQFNDEETIYGHCACLQKGKAGKNHQWVAVDCLEPTEMATAVCQKSPKEA